MRALLALVALAVSGQRTQAPASQTPAAPASQAQTPDSAHLAAEVNQRRATDKYLPDADHFTLGDRTIAANTTVDGPIAVAHGTLDVFGTVRGGVYALDGDIKIHKGAHVIGDARSAGGSVIIDGGIVDGSEGALNAFGPAVAVAESKPLTTAQSAKLVIGWFAVLAFIGVGVMIFAEGSLDGVVLGLERGFGRSFWIGLAGQVLLLPALLVLIVALAVTVIGALLIPFATVAYVIAAAGLVTLGFLGVARLTGGAFASNRGTTSARGIHVRGLFMGLGVYMGVWMVAALFTWSPVIAAVLRAVAIALTWVAATVGLGATIRSRAGTVRPGAGAGSSATDELAWQTPTPVSGVAASTRKVAITR